MQVIFLKSFFKDIKKIKDKKLKSQLRAVIIEIENAQDLYNIHNIKRLTGFQGVYRIRLGNYRLGLFLKDDTVEVARFIKREDIYKLFP